ncbi:DUF4942 domain-containing protein [Priestia aryabhattai]
MYHFNEEFYPTPTELIDRMVEGIKFRKLKTVLEPSAGYGNIALYMNAKYEECFGGSYTPSLNLDVIEIDPKLKGILKEQELRVVHDNFLTYNPFKRYDLIIMNPPFRMGAHHLNHAIELQQGSEGKIVCLLNAETIKNPHTKERKKLLRYLDELKASVEFIKDAFSNAERKTDVEVALIKIDFTEEESEIILNTLTKEENTKYRSLNNEKEEKELVIDEYMEKMVAFYNREVEANVKLINETYNVSRYGLMSTDVGKNFTGPILSLRINSKRDEFSSKKDLINEYLKEVRHRYWTTIFNSNEFSNLFTSALRLQYRNKMDELVHYDFSIYNIKTIQKDLSSMLLQSVEEIMIKLFEDLTYKNSTENEKNTHYFNGWKTNKAWKIGKKVIRPGSAYCSIMETYNPDDYRIREQLEDIEKTLSYLDGGIIKHDIGDILKQAKKENKTSNIQMKYFSVSFFSKTFHIKFTNEELLAKFNLYGSQKKGWLPPSYGKKKYDEMDQEEQAVVKSYFQDGKKKPLSNQKAMEKYEHMLENKEYYFFKNPVENWLEGSVLSLAAPIEAQEENLQVMEFKEEEVAVEEAISIPDIDNDINDENNNAEEKGFISGTITVIEGEVERKELTIIETEAVPEIISDYAESKLPMEMTVHNESDNAPVVTNVVVPIGVNDYSLIIPSSAATVSHELTPKQKNKKDNVIIDIEYTEIVAEKENEVLKEDSFDSSLINCNEREEEFQLNFAI